MSKWDILLKKREDEEKKRKEYLALLLKRKEECERDMENILKEIAKTEKYINESNEGKYLLMGDKYLKHLLKKKSSVEKRIEEVKRDIMNARILLKKAMVERKKVEKIIEKERERERMKIMKKEQEFLDEVGRHTGGSNG